jgi:hypothetical protein
MRNLLSIIVCFFFLMPLLQAQCVPNPIAVFIGFPGFYPNPFNDSIDDGTLNIPYSETITVIVPSDTTINPADFGIPLPPVTVNVNWGKITNVSGLPPGITYACNSPNCEWTGGGNGCILLSGTPTVAGPYSIEFTVEFNIVVPILGATTTPGAPVTYDMDVAGPTGVGDELDPAVFGLAQNIPNPADGLTRIMFNSPDVRTMELQLISLTGQILAREQLHATNGLNSVELDLSSLAPGVYFYRLDNGNTSLTRKLIRQ